MSMRDIYNKLKVVRALSPVDAGAGGDDTAAVTQIIDLAGYGSALFVIALGAIADANVTFAVTMDEGDASNLSDASAVAAADLLGSYAGAGFIFSSDDGVRKIGYKGTKRYVRLTITPTGNSGAWLASVVAILGHASLEPVS
ncbi:MAG TPA: hypothetical protein VN716_18860 [Vicinamibacterales bacterium]|nr:hypothetical protein [Vicinamibacterales bacterium]